MKNILCVVALIVVLVEASHYRYGTISFTKSVASPKTVTFKIDLAFRRSYSNYASYGIGQTIPSVGAMYIDSGTAASTYSNGVNAGFVVTNTDIPNDITYATYTRTFTFSGPGTYYGYFYSSARISNLNNNHDGIFQFGATVVLTSSEIALTTPVNNSPVSGLLPVVSVPYNSVPYSYQIVASDPESDALTFRLSNTNEIQGTQPTGLSCSATGLVTISSVLAQGYWSSQQVISDSYGQNIAVDYLLNVVPTLSYCSGPCGNSGTCYSNGDCNSCGSCLPANPAIVLNAIGSSSLPQSNRVAPASGSTIFVTTGQSITVYFVAYDTNLPYGSTIAMYTNGVSNFVTVAAQVACNATNGCTFVGDYAKPQLLSFTARPPASANGTVSTICVGVTSNGNALTYSQHCVTLSISAPVSTCGNSIVETGEQCDGGSCCDSTCMYSTSARTCRAVNGACDVAETCSGSSASCPADSFAATTQTCRVANGDCDVAETCSGSSASCPADSFAATTQTCRASNGPCDVAETCSGSSSSCPADSFADSTQTCRVANGVCDVAETCSGSSASCPADSFAATTQTCRVANGVCDVAETCSGSSALCPADSYADSTQTCRVANGVCDVAETCSGSSALCPADSYADSTQTCRVANGVCDVAETCSGSSSSCPADSYADSTQTCRVANGDCDVAETCSGLSTSCPADSFAASGQSCRSVNGDCDVAETCTGLSASCPVDAFVSSTQTCRASAGVCDVAESCTGSSASCPIDSFIGSSQVCRASAGVCDVAETCSGSSASCPANALAPSTQVCRPKNASAGTCDVPESCTGTSVNCPIDAVATTPYCQTANLVCPRVSNTAGGNSQFFCNLANHGSYFLCYTQVSNGVSYPTYTNMPCSAGTSCNCPYGVDCSCGGTVSPCQMPGVIPTCPVV